MLSTHHFCNSLGGTQRKSVEFMGQTGSLRKGWCKGEGKRCWGVHSGWESGLWMEAAEVAGLILSTRGRLAPGNEAALENGGWFVAGSRMVLGERMWRRGYIQPTTLKFQYQKQAQTGRMSSDRCMFAHSETVSSQANYFPLY